jgi:tRNA pseudouridine55 synthase
VSRDQVERALEEFRGMYLQSPPRYSAKKINGIAAHRLARRNKPVQPAPVSVTVSELTLVDVVDGLVRLTITASAGFYVRSLAHELGARLGCGGHLEGLRRIRAGGFGIADATPLDVIELEGVQAAERLVPMHALLPELPALVLTDAGARRASHGNDIQAEDVAAPEACPAIVPREGPPSPSGFGVTGPIRLLDRSGRLLGIARDAGGGALRPAVVLV